MLAIALALWLITAIIFIPTLWKNAAAPLAEAAGGIIGALGASMVFFGGCFGFVAIVGIATHSLIEDTGRMESFDEKSSFLLSGFVAIGFLSIVMFAFSMVRGELGQMENLNIKLKIFAQVLGIASAIVGLIYKLVF